MTTEILGFIIIIGAVIVLLARRQLNRDEDDPEVLEAATGRLRYELEQSADEIINRMTEHVDRLERLLREADHKSELLQQRIDQFQALQLGQMPQGMNVRNAVPQNVMTQEPSTPGSVPQAEMAQPQSPVQETEVEPPVPVEAQQSAPTMAPTMEMSEADRIAWDYIREASMKLEAQYEATSNTMQNAHQTDALQQAVDIQTGNVENLVGARAPDAHKGATLEEITDVESSIDIEAAAKQAREMLQQGYDVDEVSQITGLGIEAVRLISQLQEN